MTGWLPSPQLVEDAAGAIAACRPTDPTGRFEREAWLGLLHRVGPALLTRRHAPLHVTASAAVLDPSGELTCLVLHGKVGLWVQPGGHLESGDSTLAGAAARETREETGLRGVVLPEPVLLTRHRSPCAPGVVDWHLDVQFLLIAEGEPVPSDESPAVAWWPVDALPQERAGGVGELVRAARERLAAQPTPT